ncbi:hypothetical protein [Sorangium sp. So ce128]|uniref:hypothetical protein n=1 Tax=Sorangium sp. So ce128 TaxID=3133281 RepID=UPI003F63F02A
MHTGSSPSIIVTYAGPPDRSSAVARSVFRVGESITEFLDSALARRGKPPGARCWNAGAAEHRRPASSEVQ